jgi:hypothetical protein
LRINRCRLPTLSGSSQSLLKDFTDAERPCPRKRALRGSASPFQAHHRKDLLTELRARGFYEKPTAESASAESCGRESATTSAFAQPASAAEAFLT